VLILAGTPIGDASYATAALREVLRSADIIAAEDTRKLRTLLLRIGVTTDAEVVSYFDGNEVERTPGLIRRMSDGARVVLVSDAGMPSVSDPGYRLVSAAIAAGIRVTCAPGPSAVLTALAVSGLPVDRFCFEGFLPRKPGERATRLAELAAEPRTMVFFESPRRLPAFLTACETAFGGIRRAAICRELTKPYEEVIRGSLSALVAWAGGEIRGEITVVIAGADPHAVTTAKSATALELVRTKISAGMKLSTAVSEVSETLGVRRKDLYQSALKMKVA
jgi:16S rRNA (cytidine1402-2'-O)-methyltransferase